MTDYVVLDHYHDDAEGVYRLSAGKPVLDDDGNLVEHTNVIEVVFADSDKRWRNMSADKLAKAQRAEVRAALKATARKSAPVDLEPAPADQLTEPGQAL